MLLFNQILLSQIFQEKQRDILGIEDGTLQLGDCDNDGDLDILVAGYSRELNYSTARIYENDGNGSFTDSHELLPSGTALNAAWGDYDNDGDLDILVFTSTNGKLYRNDGDFNFSLISQSFPGLSYSVVKWIDIDNNGSLDIFISGYIGWMGDPVSKIYINKGGDLFEESPISLKACSRGDAEWADFNKDSYPDLLMTGSDINGNKHNTLYINNSDNTFTETNLYSSSWSYSECEWGDYDNDGDLDILLGAYESILLQNNNNVFTNSNLVLPEDMGYKIAHWGDYDNDGDLDILFSGTDLYTNERISKLYQRNDDGTYNDTEEELFGSWMSLIAWGDLDKDGDQDLIISGQVNNDSTVTIIYENLLNTGNELPSVPTGLYSIDGNNVRNRMEIFYRH